jgi:uncharacterized membrane protein (Fun14 family)
MSHPLAVTLDPSEWPARGAAIGAGIGGVVGLVVGLAVRPATAWFAVIAVGIVTVLSRSARNWAIRRR